jgi:hypothetical protein
VAHRSQQPVNHPPAALPAALSINPFLAGNRPGGHASSALTDVAFALLSRLLSRVSARRVFAL